MTGFFLADQAVGARTIPATSTFKYMGHDGLHSSCTSTKLQVHDRKLYYLTGAAAEAGFLGYLLNYVRLPSPGPGEHSFQIVWTTKMSRRNSVR
jgi:hypothetical protein